MAPMYTTCSDMKLRIKQSARRCYLIYRQACVKSIPREPGSKYHVTTTWASPSNCWVAGCVMISNHALRFFSLCFGNAVVYKHVRVYAVSLLSGFVRFPQPLEHFITLNITCAGTWQLQPEAFSIRIILKRCFPLYITVFALWNIAALFIKCSRNFVNFLNLWFSSSSPQ